MFIRKIIFFIIFMCSILYSFNIPEINIGDIKTKYNKYYQKNYIIIDISSQKLYLLNKDNIIDTFQISSSKFGIGNKINSYKTPLGFHIIIQKIGTGEKTGTIFKCRKSTGKIANINYTKIPSDKDFITSRILRLKGLEKGKNLYGDVDSYKRCIYIHGTSDEGLIGEPASYGCIRMKNKDIIELYKRVKKNTLVYIKE